MRKPNANKPQRKSKPKIAPDRERDIISNIERLNEELIEASDARKLYLINQRRRLEAMLDPVSSLTFDISCEIVTLKKELTQATGRKKSSLKSKIRRLEVKLTAWKKQKAAEDKRPIIAKYQQDIRQHGAPANNTEFIRRLRDDGVLTKTRFGKKWPVSDTTARTVLRSVFGVKGQRGRKPGASE